MDQEEKTEEQLTVELEAMYKRVASTERPADDDMQVEELGADQPPKKSVTRTVDDEDIQAEEILAYQQRAEILTNAAAGGAHEIEQRSMEETPPGTPQAVSAKGGRRMLAGALAGALVLVCVVIFGAFVWPTLYEVASITKDGKVYPLRTNRITGNVAYFDGGEWLTAPVPETRAPVPVSAVPVPAATLPARTTALPEKEKMPDHQKIPMPSKPLSEAKTSSAHAAKHTPPDIDLKNRLFTVQIKAFNDPVEAQKLVAELKSTEVDVFSVAAPVGESGIWHRVLIGRFKNPDEALNYMQKYKIRKYFPDSFVQKLSP